MLLEYVCFTVELPTASQSRSIEAPTSCNTSVHCPYTTKGHELRSSSDLSGRRGAWSTPTAGTQGNAVFSPGPGRAPGPQTSFARWRPLGPPQAGRSLARACLRRQGAELRTTAPTASRCRTDSLGALGARAPSRASTQGSRSRRVLLILERRVHSCDELHVARREVPFSHREDEQPTQN